ncbi:fumarylacetoacetate hydrolase family protein [Paracoccus sp. Ld10]|uniref:fumarylacetoacetate hydrolase family protein n=1 Tax=Paracoccus sp. Ld10 TaxID=649158 RepID=UPI00386ABAD8
MQIETNARIGFAVSTLNLSKLGTKHSFAMEGMMQLATIRMGRDLQGAVITDDGNAYLIGMSVMDVIAGGRVGNLSDLRMVPAGQYTLAAPIPAPAKNIFCVGRNYMEHIAEGDRAQKRDVGVTEVPVYFTKPPTAITDPDGVIPIFPHVSTNIDYEVELAVIIGKSGRDISRENAMDHVFGYTILNDISARDIQRLHGGQYFKGKGLDGSAPMGPWIVTADQIGDPHDLGIRCSVNGEIRQDGNTRDMVFDIPTLIASLSAGMTLEPGDIIATGTPSGVGYAMDPPQYLRDGDSVTCEIDGIGRLTNTMQQEVQSKRSVA